MHAAPEHDPPIERPPSIRSRGIYLLPNLLTTAALFAGFYAIVAAMQGEFEWAAMAIVVAIGLDGLDGRVARMTRTQTHFGAEYDSLSDMVAFGVAPALMAYHWCLIQLGKGGWLVAFFYTASTALRLARFNTQLSSSDKHYFQGLPSPAAAGMVACAVWWVYAWPVSMVDPIRQFWGYQLLFAALLMLSGLLMVSRVRYQSFKQWDTHNRVPFWAVCAGVLLFVGVSISPVHVLGLIFAAYWGSGPIWTVWSLRQTQNRRRGGGQQAP